MDCTCMDLALEGERLCKAGDCSTGVQFFEAAVQTGTDDLKTLSAIYSQLGNAYFYLQQYGKALEYHRLDLELARTLGDKVGEAKASGNLGNTLKVLGKFEEAVACCTRHLDISRELCDKVGEARALYNLGNVYHGKGKQSAHSGQQDPGEFSPEVKESLQKAAEYYKSNLNIMRDLNDRAAQGRACGNLGNTHYLLGNFSMAINYHEERLSIAKEFGDKAAERRAYTNLGNAHIFLGEFDVAAEYYKKSLQIATQLSEKALEAQACYSLGNTYILLRDYDKAIEYHRKHHRIAQELHDRVGEGRACWSLGNAHNAIGNHQDALKFATQHLEISKEIGDESGQLTAKMNLADIKSALGISSSKDSPVVIIDSHKKEYNGTVPSIVEDGDGLMKASRPRRHSMEKMELMRLTPDRSKKAELKVSNKGVRPKQPLHKSLSDSEEVAKKQSEKENTMARSHTADFQVHKDSGDENGDEDSFFELLSRFQSRRIDDQRCSFRLQENNSPEVELLENRVTPPRQSTQGPTSITSPGAEELMDMVAGIQRSRMNDQRADAQRFPGLRSQEVIDQLLQDKKEDGPDDSFFEMLMRCQGSRINDQRSSLPRLQPAPTVPDEDFFSLIQRVQSSRLDEQRTNMPRRLFNNLPGKKKKK